MVEVLVVKGGRTRRFDPTKDGKPFLAKAAIKPPAPIAHNKPPEVRVPGVQLLLASETTKPRQPETVTTADFAAMFEGTEPAYQKPRRTVYNTRLPHWK